MTPREFEDFLVTTRAELTQAMQHGKVEDLDVYTKTVLDYQENIAKALFNKLNSIENALGSVQLSLNQTKGDVLKDNRERHQAIIEAIKELK